MNIQIIEKDKVETLTKIKNLDYKVIFKLDYDDYGIYYLNIEILNSDNKINQLFKKYINWLNQFIVTSYVRHCTTEYDLTRRGQKSIFLNYKNFIEDYFQFELNIKKTKKFKNNSYYQVQVNNKEFDIGTLPFKILNWLYWLPELDVKPKNICIESYTSFMSSVEQERFVYMLNKYFSNINFYLTKLK